MPSTPRAGAAPTHGRQPKSAHRGAPAGQSGFVLRVVEGPKLSREYAFVTEAMIGRVEGNHIVLVEPGVSRQHARVYESHGAFLLEDLQSANGTRLNGEKIHAPEVLRDGDHLTVGQTTFLFATIDTASADATRVSTIEPEVIAADGIFPSPDLARPAWQRRRRWVGAVVTLVLLAAGGGLWWRWHKQSGQNSNHQSAVAVAYAEQDGFFRQVFGYGQYDQSHPEQLVVTFRYLDGRVTLQFGAWGVDKVGELVVRLNGHRVADVAPTMGRWVYGNRIVLPQEQLRRGAINTVVFDNTRNPPARDPWEVCFVQIHQEVLPQADPQAAQRQFELGQSYWEDRHVDPRNAYAALIAFRRARDLLERLQPKVELYLEATDAIDRVDAELTQRFEEGLFSAQRAVQVDGDVRAAQTLLNVAMRYFDHEDYRYRELKHYHQQLAEQLDVDE